MTKIGNRSLARASQHSSWPGDKQVEYILVSADSTGDKTYDVYVNDYKIGRLNFRTKISPADPRKRVSEGWAWHCSVNDLPTTDGERYPTRTKATALLVNLYLDGKLAS